MRKVAKPIFSACITGCVLLMTGCEPELMEVTVTTSAIDSALAGESASADVRIYREFGSSDEPATISRIVSIVKKCCGESNVVVTSEGEGKKKMEVRINATVTKADKEKVDNALVHVVINDDGLTGVVPNMKRLEKLNRALKNVNSSYATTIIADKTKITFVGSGEKAHEISALAVSVGGKESPELEARLKIAKGGSECLEYHAGTSGIYKGRYPQFRIDPTFKKLDEFKVKNEESYEEEW